MEEPERNVRIVSKILCHLSLWQASKQFGRPKSRQNGLLLPATELSLNELWNTTDLILQHVRESELPFGVVFVLANGDALQLPSPTGTPIWDTTAALLLFRFDFLQEFVRMSHPEGQRLLKTLANRPLT